MAKNVANVSSNIYSIKLGTAAGTAAAAAAAALMKAYCYKTLNQPS